MDATTCPASPHNGIEFLQVDGRPLLIDFNPRYFHYMALDIARGVPLPLMTRLAALGDRARLGELVRQANTRAASDVPVFTYGLQLSELLLAQQLTGRMSRAESKGWRDWRRQHRGALVDAVDDPGDRLPWVVDVATSLVERLRHPLRFIRRVAFDA
jgi:hypothetical protein